MSTTPDWQRRVINRVAENTLISKSTALQFFDGVLGEYHPGSKVIHNGEELEEGRHFVMLANDIQIKVQLQPNDRFGISPPE